MPRKTEGTSRWMKPGVALKLEAKVFPRSIEHGSQLGEGGAPTII